MKARIFIIIILLLILIFSSGCNIIISFFDGNEEYYLVIDPENIIIPAGDSVHFRLYKVDNSTGESADVSQNAGWSSSNPDVASISPTGYAVAYTIGTTTIKGSYEGKSASTNLLVYEGSPEPTPEQTCRPGKVFYLMS